MPPAQCGPSRGLRGRWAPLPCLPAWGLLVACPPCAPPRAFLHLHPQRPGRAGLGRHLLGQAQARPPDWARPQQRHPRQHWSPRKAGCQLGPLQASDEPPERAGRPGRGGVQGQERTVMSHVLVGVGHGCLWQLPGPPGCRSPWGPTSTLLQGAVGANSTRSSASTKTGLSKMALSPAPGSSGVKPPVSFPGCGCHAAHTHTSLSCSGVSCLPRCGVSPTPSSASVPKPPGDGGAGQTLLT